MSGSRGELAQVQDARRGDRSALVALYRQDAPAAWRLALALTADADRARAAVVEGFRGALAPARPGEPPDALSHRARLLRATRLAVLDPSPPVPAAAARDDRSQLPQERMGRGREVMTAFAQLPERSRTVLWLLAAEGLTAAEAAAVLAVPADQVHALADRSLDALDEQWWLDRQAAGETEGITEVPEGLVRHLQPRLPLPADLFAAVEAAWRDRHRRAVGSLGLALPGGWVVPRWAERTLIGATAALITLGIASAVVVDNDPSSPRHGGVVSASRHEGPTSTEPTPGPGPGPVAVDQGGTAEVFNAPGSPAAPSTVAAAATTSGDPFTSMPTTTTSAPPHQSPATTPTTPAGAQVTVGVAPLLGISLGTCTGLDVAGHTVGCPPPTNPTGVTLKGQL